MSSAFRFRHMTKAENEVADRNDESGEIGFLFLAVAGYFLLACLVKENVLLPRAVRQPSQADKPADNV